MNKIERLVWIRCDSLETEMHVRKELEKAKRNGCFTDVAFVISFGDEIAIEDPERFLAELERLAEELRRTNRRK